jgi:hypothetical protein
MARYVLHYGEYDAWTCIMKLEIKNMYTILDKKPYRMRLLGTAEIEGKIMSKCVLKTGCGLDSSGSEQGLVVGSCQHAYEFLCSTKGKEFLDHKQSAP